jgi:hypothetical protein
MAFRYKQPVQGKGERPPVKSRVLGNHSSLGVYMYAIQHIRRRRTRPSTGPERSQQLQILPSLNSKAILQRIRLLFLLRQHFRRHQRFWMNQVFSIHQRFWMRQVFSIRQRFGCANITVSPVFFGCANVLCISYGAYIFVYFSAFLFSMRQ